MCCTELFLNPFTIFCSVAKYKFGVNMCAASAFNPPKIEKFPVVSLNKLNSFSLNKLKSKLVWIALVDSRLINPAPGNSGRFYLVSQSVQKNQADKMKVASTNYKRTLSRDFIMPRMSEGKN